MEDLNDDAPAGPSVSKEPEKGPFYDAEPEEDLDVSGAQNQLWLVKVPKFLYDAWAQVQTGGQLLGTVRLYDPEPGSAKTEMELLLPTEPAAAVPLPPSALVREPTLAHIPRQYNLRLTDQHNMGARNIFAFKEKRPDEDVAAEKERRARKARRKAEGKEVADTSESDEESESEDEDVLPLQTGGQPIVKKRKKHSKFRRHTAIVGKVANEAAIAPQVAPSLADVKPGASQSLSARLAAEKKLDGYRRMLKLRSSEAVKPKQQVIMMDDVDAGLESRITSGLAHQQAGFTTGKVVKQGRGVEKFARMPRTDLLQRLFALFEKYKYYQFQTLRQQTEQPEPYLREVLSSIAQMERKGTYAGYWALRPEYSASKASHQQERDRALAQQQEKQLQDKGKGREEEEVVEEDEEDDDDDDDDSADDPE